MKFTKVVIVAGALAVSTVPQIAHSQDAATSVTSQDSRVAEWNKKVGMDCTVIESNSKVASRGKLESVTDSWIEVSNDVRRITEVGPIHLTYGTRIPMGKVVDVKFEDETEKFTKIAPPARLSFSPSALHRTLSEGVTTKVLPPAKLVFPPSALIRSQPSIAVAPPTVAEVEKAAKLQQVVGKNCKVRLFGEKSEDFHEGIAESVTTDWIILKSEGEEEENGKTVKVKNRIHLPMKEVNVIEAFSASTK